MEEQIWVVFVENKDYEGSTNIEGIVYDLDTFKKIAREKYKLQNEPEKDFYGRGSLHYEWWVQISDKFSEYYHLVAQPVNIL